MDLPEIAEEARKRTRYAYRVLRGRPLAYRVTFEGTLFPRPITSDIVVAECEFRPVKSYYRSGRVV